MIRIIKSHNELNGLKFVVFEFGLMLLFLLPFGIYCLLNQKLLLGLYFSGVGLNCLPVAYYALHAIQKGQNPGSIWDPQAREELIAKNPHILRDTFTLVVATLVPFLVLMLVLVEGRRARRGGKDKRR